MYTQEALDDIAESLISRPCKTLDWHTPLGSLGLGVTKFDIQFGPRRADAMVDEAASGLRAAGAVIALELRPRGR